MNKKMLKISFISISIILFTYIFINNFLLTISYSEDILSILGNFFIECLLNFNIIDVIALIILSVGIIIKPEINDSNSIPENTNIKKHKNLLWKILLGVGILPFAIILILSIINIFIGFTFFFSTAYGFEAFINSIVLYSFIFGPLYVIGAILIILSIIKIIKNNKI